jgi:hypothetical protein
MLLVGIPTTAKIKECPSFLNLQAFHPKAEIKWFDLAGLLA